MSSTLLFELKPDLLHKSAKVAMTLGHSTLVGLLHPGQAIGRYPNRLNIGMMSNMIHECGTLLPT